MATTNISIETQVAAAKEVFMIEETGKTKTQIANEFGISARSLNRYFDKYKDDFVLVQSDEVDSLNSAFEESKQPIVDFDENHKILQGMEYYSTLSTNEQVILAKYYDNKKLDLVYDKDAAKVGRTPKGTKPTRDVIMEIIEKHLFSNTLTKSNKQKIAEEISHATGHNINHSKFMFTKLKRLFGASKLS